MHKGVINKKLFKQLKDNFNEMEKMRKDRENRFLLIIYIIVLFLFSCGVIYGVYNVVKEKQMLEIKLKNSEKLVSHFMEKSMVNKAFRIKVTGYHPASGGTNSDSNPLMTATMTPHKAGRTCAISTELVEAGWLGKEIYIEGFGMMIANDRLNKNIKGKQIDLCKGTLEQALAVGVNLDVLATLVDRNNINKVMEGYEWD